jgi:hypothetical protein
MALPPIQQFRPEDFPELEKEKWASKLFSKLNGLARQTQLVLDKGITVETNMAGFWWEGIVGPRVAAPNVNYPYTQVAPTIGVDPAGLKEAPPIKAFPFTIPNELPLRRVKGVFVAQAYDYTNRRKSVLPAMLAGVAWEQTGDKVTIFGINGMYIGINAAGMRNYFVRLLILCD